MTLAKVHVNWSEILMDRLGPDISPMLWMKGQVLHRERAHLKVLGWSLVWNKLLTEKLPMFLSRLNEISGGCDKILTVSESFWSNLKFVRSLITDHYKPLKAVQHGQMKNWPVLWSQLSTIPWKSWFSHSFVIREMLIHIFIAYHNKSCCQLTFETTDKPVF